MMFTTIPEDVCMIMKFLSNSPVTHIGANTHPAVPIPAVITVTCNYNFAVNKWNHAAGWWEKWCGTWGDGLLCIGGGDGGDRAGGDLGRSIDRSVA